MKVLILRSINKNLLDVLKFVGLKTLILGDINVGKTIVTAQLISKFRKKYKDSDITIIDFAPERIKNVGGSLIKYLPNIGNIRYLKPDLVYAPRLMGRDENEILKLAEYNANSIEQLLKDYINNPTPLLIINDITIYLQMGNIETFLKTLEFPETFLANGYYGIGLLRGKGYSLSWRERRNTILIAKKMHQIIILK